MAAVILLVVLIFALAFWSEREDSQRLPPAELEGVEEGVDGRRP